MTLYGYARVSTKKQSNNNNSLEYQTLILTQAHVPSNNIYIEQYTGKTTDRPVLNDLIAQLQPNDTLVVTKLDRLARSVKEGIELIDTLTQRNIAIHILNLGTLDNSPQGKLMRNVFLAFAEFERDMILARTQEGIELARQKGVKFGRPQHEQTTIDLVDSLVAQGLSITQACKQANISRASYYKLRNN